MARKIIQVAVDPTASGTVIVLCDDGTLWERSNLTTLWAQVETATVDIAAAMVGTVEAPPAADPAPV